MRRRLIYVVLLISTVLTFLIPSYIHGEGQEEHVIKAIDNKVTIELDRAVTGLNEISERMAQIEKMIKLYLYVGILDDATEDDRSIYYLSRIEEYELEYKLEDIIGDSEDISDKLDKILSHVFNKMNNLSLTEEDAISNKKELTVMYDTLYRIEEEFVWLDAMNELYEGTLYSNLDTDIIDDNKNKLIEYISNFRDNVYSYEDSTLREIITKDEQIEIDAEDLYNSIYDVSKEKLIDDYLELISLTSTFQPLMDTTLTSDTHDILTETQMEIINKFGEFRKPLYISNSKKPVKDLLEGKTVSAVPATLGELNKKKSSSLMLYIKMGNDNVQKDTSTIDLEDQDATYEVIEDEEKGYMPIFATERSSIPSKSITEREANSRGIGHIYHYNNNDMNFVLLNNILSGQRLSYEEQNMFLFLDVFGNIVLEDNTILIPSIANANMYENKSDYSVMTKAFHNNYPDTLNMEKKKVDDTYGIAYDSTIPAYRSYKIVHDTKWYNDFIINKFYKNPYVSTYTTMKPYYRIDEKNDIKIYNFTGTGHEDAVGDMTFGKLMSSIITLHLEFDVMFKNDEPEVVTENGRNSLNIFKDNKEMHIILRNANMDAIKNDSIKLRQSLLAKIAKETSKGVKDVTQILRLLETELSEEQRVINILRGITVPLVDNFLKPIKGFTYLKEPQNHIITSLLIRYKTITRIIGIILAGFLISKLYQDNIGLVGLLISVVVYLLIFVIGVEAVMTTTINTYNGIMSIDVAGISDRRAVYISSALTEEYRLSRGQGYTDSKYTKITDEDYHKFMGSPVINLYELSKEDLENIYKEGDDRTARYEVGEGMYIEGKYLKISTSDLFSKISIQDNLHSITDQSEPEQIITIEKIETNIENYTPYFDFVRHMTLQLAKYMYIAKPSRRPIRYSTSLNKMSYAWESLSNSVLILNQDEISLLDEELQEKVYEYYNLDDLFDMRELGSIENFEYTNEYGYKLLNMYKDNMKSYEKNLSIFAQGANYRVIKFLTESQPILSYISDETLTKVISLIVLEEFNSVMSNPLERQNLYPKYQNMSDLSFEQLLFSTTNEKDLTALLSSNSSLVKYMEINNGILGHILLLVYVPVQVVNLFLISFLPFIMIALLFIITFIRIFKRDEIFSTVKGFIIVLGIFIVVSTIHSKILLTPMRIGVKLIVSFVIALLNLDFMFSYIKALIAHPYDLGMSTLGMSYSSSRVGKLTGKAISLPKRSKARMSEAMQNVTRSNNYTNYTQNVIDRIERENS